MMSNTDNKAMDKSTEPKRTYHLTPSGNSDIFEVIENGVDATDADADADADADYTAAADDDDADANNNHKDEDNEDDDDDDDDDDNEIRTLNYWDSVIVLSSFSTAGAVISMPFAIGQLGYILGPVAMIVVYVISVCFINVTLNVVNEYETSAAAAAAASAGSTTQNNETNTNTNTNTNVLVITNLGDVGFVLAGKSENGRLIINIFQIIGLLLGLPVILEIIGTCLQYYFNGDCLGYYNIIAWIGLLIIVQFIHGWDHVAFVSYITCAFAVAVSFIFLPIVYVQYSPTTMTNTTIGTNITEDNNATDTTNTTSANIDYLGPVQAFGNVQPTWYNYAFAMTMFFFGFVPMFILYEMRNDMKNPSTSQVKSVLWVSTTFLILLYAIPGLICVILWGYNIKNPIIAELPRSNWIAYVITSYVFISLIMDYCIITKVLRDHIIAAAAGATTAATTATTAAATRCKLSSTIYFNRFLCSLPQLIFALVVALTVPNFSSVVGISSGIITVGCQNWLIVLLLEYGYVRGGVYPSQQPNRILMNIGAFVTFLFTIWIVSSSIYEVITANYSDNFFCSG